MIRKHRDLQHLYGEAPAAIEAAIAGFNKQVAVASIHLKESEYLVGKSFTGADLMLAGILQWAKDYGFDLDPTLTEYTNRQRRRPAYIAANKLNKSIVGLN